MIKKLITVMLVCLTVISGIGWDQPVTAATALPRIVTQAGSPAYFAYLNGTEFTPGGMNYTKVWTMDWQTKDYGINQLTTGTWDTHNPLLVNNFDLAKVTADLGQMAYDGYNTIRVFINQEGTGTYLGQTYYGIAGPRATGNDHWNGLYKPYMDNVVDFLQVCEEKGIYATLVLPYIPDNDYYQTDQGQYFYGLPKPKDSNGDYYIDNVNLLFMEQGYIDAKTDYIENFVQYIKNEDVSLLTSIFSIDFYNEINIVTNAAPFTRTDSVTTADGVTYDMSLDADRQQCVDANIINWANQCMTALHSVDPDAMGTAGIFTFKAVGLAGPNGVHQAGPEYRYPARPNTLALYSNLSYLDIHLYPHGPGTAEIDIELNSSEFSTIPTSNKPLVLGEFGAVKSFFNNNISTAAYNMRYDKDYCRDHKNFKGWMFWTWDSNQSVFYNATESSGAINGQLAPSVWGY